MNNKLRTTYFFVCLFLMDFALYADPDDDFQPEPDAAPINSNLIVLGIAGLIFACYTLRKRIVKTP